MYIASSRGRNKKDTYTAIRTKVYIVLDGEGTFQVGRETRVLGPGLGTLAPAGEEHGVKNLTQQRLRVLVFVAPNP